jgi:hypothetical protein
MSAEIIKVYKQDVPALRFIGKKYGDEDRVDGLFGKQWEDWRENGWFDLIKKQTAIDLKTMYEDSGFPCGLMWDKNDVFEYWIGIFMPEDTSVPEGYDFYDFPKAAFGVCWLYGEESEVFCLEGMCGTKLEEQGYKYIDDKENTIWCFERYTPRIDTPDEKGKVILDICFYVK